MTITHAWAVVGRPCSSHLCKVLSRASASRAIIRPTNTRRNGHVYVDVVLCELYVRHAYNSFLPRIIRSTWTLPFSWRYVNQTFRGSTLLPIGFFFTLMKFDWLGNFFLRPSKWLTTLQERIVVDTTTYIRGTRGRDFIVKHILRNEDGGRDYEIKIGCIKSIWLEEYPDMSLNRMLYPVLSFIIVWPWSLCLRWLGRSRGLVIHFVTWRVVKRRSLAAILR